MTGSIGGINKFGLDYTPVSSYNKLLENSLGDINTGLSEDGVSGDFDGILNGKISSLQNQNYSNPMTAGINMNVNNTDINAVSNVENIGGSTVGDVAHSIGNAFGNSMQSLNDKQVQAEKAMETLAAGGDISVHDVMIATEKANLNMQMAIQLRNKVLTAYNELYQIRF